MSSTIGTAYIQIEPSAEGIQGKISNVLDKEAGNAGKQAGGKLSNAFGAAAKGMVSAAVGIGTAAAGASAALVGTASATAQAGDNIDKMSQKLGVSSSFYQEWDAVLQHSGTSMDSMGATFKKLATASQDATDDQIAAFKQLGLSMDEVSNMSAEDLFTSVVSGLQGMEEGTERTALATTLLGKGAMELGPLLNTSAEDTQAMIDAVNELGGVMSDDAVKNSAAFQDQLQDMQTAMTGVKNNIITELLPGFTDLMGGFTGLITGSDGASEQLTSGMQSIADNLTSSIPMIIEGLKAVLPAILEVAPELIRTLAEGILSALPELLPTLVQLILDITMMLIDLAPQLLEAAVSIVTAIGQGLWDNKEIIISKLSDLVGNLVTFLVGLASKFGTFASEIVAKIRTSLAEKWGNLKTYAGTLITQLKDKFIEKVKDFISLGKDIVDGIKEGITGAWSNLKESVKELAGGLVSGVKDFFKIGSPSKMFRDEVGKWIPAGIAEGINDGVGVIQDAISDMSIGTLNAAVSSYAPMMSGQYDFPIAPQAQYEQSSNSQTNIIVTLEGDAKRLFRVMQSESVAYKRTTGREAYV